MTDASETRGDDGSESDGVQCWLVERTFDDRNLVTIVYATPAGNRYHQRERSAQALRTGSAVTAGVTLDPESLEPVGDGETREWYAAEAKRVAATHEPGDPI